MNSRFLIALLCFCFLPSELSLSAQGVNPPPHIVLISGDAEYSSRETCRIIAAKLKNDFGFRTTLIESYVGSIENETNPDRRIPGLEAIREADLLIIYVRMRFPPQEQLDLLHQYFEAGKPAIGIRTTTHGFTNDRGWCPRYFGGHYWSHFGGQTETYTLPRMNSHPVLRGVPPWKDQLHNTLYLTNPLSDTATPLVMGRRDDTTPAQAYAWINEYKPDSRQFFFTASHPEDIADDNNQAMLYNAVFWALKLEVPREGVIASFDGKFLKESVPYHQSTHSIQPVPPSLDTSTGMRTLFDGTDLNQWDYWFGGKEPRVYELDGRAHSGEGLPDFSGARWKLVGRAVEAVPAYGDLVTREQFTDYILRFDFLIPETVENVPRIWKGNSGVYLNGSYEIQLLDSRDEEPSITSCGAVNGVRAPIKKAWKAAGEWQQLEVVFRAARFRNEDKISPARVSARLNGELIHDNVRMSEPTRWGFEEEGSNGPQAGPIRLQADSSPVRFANIQIETLTQDQVYELLPNRREPTGRAWVDMDYGPYLTASIEVEEGNIAYKGIAVRLDGSEGGISAGNDFIVFDTDTLRVASAWSGPDFIDWRSIVFDGSHQTHPSLVGHSLYRNPVGPGWGNPVNGSFGDQRLLGRDGLPYGPISRDWGHWKGLYLHDDQVIFSYTVGKTSILETHGKETFEEVSAYSRTLNIGPRDRDLLLQVAHDPKGEFHFAPFPYESGELGRIAMIELPEARKNETKSEVEFQFDGRSSLDISDSELMDWTGKDFTILASIRTEDGGTILAKAPPEGIWVANAKTFFIREGILSYDIGWVGAVESEREIDDGEWHQVGMTYSHQDGRIRMFIDGVLEGEGRLKPREPVEGHVVRIGYASPDFPEVSGFSGAISRVKFYQSILPLQQIEAFAEDQDQDQGEGILGDWLTKELKQGRLRNSVDSRYTARIVRHAAGERRGRRNTDARGSSFGNHRITAAAVKGKLPGMKWIAPGNGSLRLLIPAGSNSASLKILITKIESTESTGGFESLIQHSAMPGELKSLIRGGSQRWNKEIKTQIAPYGPQKGPFTVQTLTPPMKNPYGSWMRLGGFDFFEDGKRAAVCTWMGDVWIVEGVDQDKGELIWKRIASGMFQPLGLKIVNETIFVTCRDQITVLRDLNGDGETDFYQNFNNDAQVTEHFHEFAMDLQTDDDGNFYYAKGARHALDALVPQHGTLIQVSPDGFTSKIIASGFRAPNGVCVTGDGTFIMSDQEGHWTPKNRINWIRPGGFYGNMMGYHKGRSDDDFLPPITWIHNEFDRSPAEQLWVDSEVWGPLKGALLNFSYGTGELSLVLTEKVGDVMQGGVVKMPTPMFPTGIMRGRFHPGNGQLYGCGLFGWSSNRTSPGGFYRINYSGKTLNFPIGLNAVPEGMVLTFTDPLDSEFALDTESYSVRRWNYRRSSDYGSADYSIARPGRRGRDEVTVSGVRLSDDKKSILLEIPDMKPSMQMEIVYELLGEDGSEISHVIENTIHVIGRNGPFHLGR